MASMYLPAIAKGTYNAKTLPLASPLTAADNYGVTPDNAAQKFAKIWADRATVDGGSKAIYDKMAQWASPQAVTDRGGDPNDTQWALMRQALQTGKIDPRLNPDLIQRGLGLGLSETARAQQHKPVNFFTEYLMDPLVEIGLNAIPGVGQALAIGYGAIKGGVDDGFLGALKGGIGAYGATSVANKVGGFLRGGGFTAPAGLGLSGNNLALPGLQNATAATNVGGYGAGALGLTGENLGLNLASGLGAAAPVLGQGVSAIARASDIYQPQALGGRVPTFVDSARRVADRLVRGADKISRAVSTDFTPSSDEQSTAMSGMGFLPRQAYDTRGGQFIAPMSGVKTRRLARLLAAANP